MRGMSVMLHTLPCRALLEVTATSCPGGLSPSMQGMLQ